MQRPLSIRRQGIKMPWPRPNGHQPSRCRWERHEPKCVRSSLARARAASSTHSGNSIPAIDAPTCCGGPARADAMLAGSIWLIDLRQRNRRNGLVLELSDTLPETVSDSGSPETGLAIRPIFDAVELLQESRRTASLLVGIDGLCHRPAADTLDIPIGTIVTRISRERKAIRMVFDGSGESRMETGHRIDVQCRRRRATSRACRCAPAATRSPAWGIAWE
ncbi:DNA-directed RNA polymerase sigma-70 factor [Burkholderia contaminans]|nr:DNA-directed RNA polymerase sigma-70 factor [Burkholderia contaminans]VWC90066.1 DNA-directed RNA polymerase sigma-70 factor [Burkholderia contaminans]